MTNTKKIALGLLIIMFSAPSLLSYAQTKANTDPEMIRINCHITSPNDNFSSIPTNKHGIPNDVVNSTVLTGDFNKDGYGDFVFAYVVLNKNPKQRGKYLLVLRQVNSEIEKIKELGGQYKPGTYLSRIIAAVPAVVNEKPKITLIKGESLGLQLYFHQEGINEDYATMFDLNDKHIFSEPDFSNADD